MSENKGFCAVCGAIAGENASVLAYGAFGTPRLLCPSCEEELDTSTTDKTPENIKAAMTRLGEKMTANNADDLTVEALNELLLEASERAKAIEKGEYDFSQDEQPLEAEGFEEIPEELRETEEDIALDENDRRRSERFDKIFNIIAAVAFLAVLGFLAYRIISGLLV